MPQPFRLSLRVLGEPVVIEGEAPDGPMRLDEALPLLYGIDDQTIAAAVKREEQAGRSISCRKGCSACCRGHAVPITPAEAYRLTRLVEELPEPRRSVVRERFQAAVTRLTEAGLLDAYLRRVPVTSGELAGDVSRRFFALGIACPFLDDDVCSIHPQRPFVCREYHVTTPADLCRDPYVNRVAVVDVPPQAAGALLRVSRDLLGTAQDSLPLVLAFEYVAEHREELERTFDARELLGRSVRALGGG
jgi:Fe-S-cluster containining protein